MPQAPVATCAYAQFCIPQVALAQWLGGLRITPAVYLGIRRLGAYAGDFGKRFEQFGLDALDIVFQVALRPFWTGLYGPALNRATPGLG